MFKKDAPVVSGKVDTLIGAGTIIEGHVKATGILRVEGRILGEVVSDGDIMVGEKGDIKANIRAHHVTVAGKVSGNIHASGRMHLMATGNLQGDVEAATVMIEEGAHFKGACKMTDATGSGKNRSPQPELEREPFAEKREPSTTTTVSFAERTPIEQEPEPIRSATHTPLW